MQPGKTIEGARTQARRLFRTLDANQVGRLNPADVRLHEAVAGARLSAAMVFMNADLDADGAVTEDELLTKRRYEQRQREVSDTRPDQAAEKAISEGGHKLMAADVDKDARMWKMRPRRTTFAIEPTPRLRRPAGRPV